MAKRTNGSTRAYADATSLADAWGMLHDVQLSLRRSWPLTADVFDVLIGRVVQARHVVATVRRFGRDDYDRSAVALGACVWTLRSEVVPRFLAEIERRPADREALEPGLRWAGDLADEWEAQAGPGAFAVPGLPLSPGGDA